jgi:hypothetical protein
MARSRGVGRVVTAVRTIAILAALSAAAMLRAEPAPWDRTETRAPCAVRTPLRSAWFGDTHVHTAYSFDAVSGGIEHGPREAYRFAQGETIVLPPGRMVRLGRPLDFTMVSDHAELFGEVRSCLTPGLPGYDDQHCQDFRANIPQTTPGTSFGITQFAILYVTVAQPERFAFCGPDGSVCLGQASLVWDETRAAAEEFYDRTAACGFTTFVGYEWSGNPVGSNLHRNVMFRNANVPALPVSYVEKPTPEGLWNELQRVCLDGVPGCDVLAIPHNSNVSNGRMFLPENFDGTPLDAAAAAFRSTMEPVVEITQHKGDSECRPGILSNDEQCGYEKWSGAALGGPPARVFPPINFVRNALKEGLAQEAKLGVNPFRLGFIGSTDTHSGVPGATREDDYVGHLGLRDATRELMVQPLEGFGVIGGIESNPGGLAVAWAEENSRDAIFAAFRRREVYGTSGTRPTLRFFGGGLRGVRCKGDDLVERGYATGTPMGGELGAVRGGRSPRFAVLAFQDAGEPGVPGTPLQRVQIVKGWIDKAGERHEQVFDVAGDANSGAGVDPRTCATSGTGASSLCAVWTDREFDPRERAFYYARVLENPVCRWSTRLCNANGVDCANPATIPAGMEACCDARYPKTIQERAWASPIWYRPEAIARVQGGLRAGRTPADSRLLLSLDIARVPTGFDPVAAPLTIRLRDDDSILDVTPKLRRVASRRWTYDDPAGRLGGLRKVTVQVRGSGQATIRIDARGAALAAADQETHVVELTLESGTYRTSHARRWRWRRNRLAPEREV